MYSQGTSVEKIVNNTKTSPKSEPSPENDREQIADFSQPSQHQMPLFYNSSQQNQQQNINAYIENYAYIQHSWNYLNYYGHNYYPSIHGHSSGMMQSAAQYSQQPQHSQMYKDYKRSVNNENKAVNAHESLLKKPRRTRSFYSNEQIFELETYFNKTNMYLPGMDRAKLSKKIRLSEKQIKTWFRNRRMKHKKMLSLGPNRAFQAISNNIKEDDSIEVKTEATGNDS
ncbi:unnamed protein product [Psylliodes chrysocephalus]|uniref:Homeobox domain-containing protein n=1 Tax=Psylliodes chrysocephalus TaxID=3402493 RepID=A0A9P0D695_9CUCU|nr:unnamed protein product [Psylliodes chrysocephala]